MPSTTTIALSTSMPRAITSAPSEIRSRATFHGPMKMNVDRIVSARTAPMISALRRPMNSSEHDYNDHDSLDQADQKTVDCNRDRVGLKRDDAEIHAQRDPFAQLVHARLDRFAHLNHVAASSGGDAQADGGVTVELKHVARGFDVTSPDVCHVA